MKSRMMQFVPAVVALIAVGFGNFSQWCVSIDHMCYRTIIEQIIPEITYPLYFFALYTLPITIILVFVPREIFKSWLKFVVWALPLAFLYIATTPPASWAKSSLSSARSS